MKSKISVTIDAAMLRKVKEHIDKGTYRNTSHAVEFALKKITEENDE